MRSFGNLLRAVVLKSEKKSEDYVFCENEHLADYLFSERLRFWQTMVFFHALRNCA